MNRSDVIRLYEELSMNAHPALQTQHYDGWVLRFADGYTNRANSVNPLYPSNLPAGEKIAFCERLYAKQRLPAVFKLTEGSPAGLDDILVTRGYEVATPTCVFTNDALPSGRDGGVTVTNTITPAWRADFFRLNGLNDPVKTTAASAMMGHIRQDVLCASIVDGGEAVACGLCVVERGYAGLYDIVVDDAHRRQGYGYALCKTLLAAAAAIGAKAAYLQVVAANAPATALYAKLGYAHCYRYWYRVKKGEAS